MPTFGSRGPSPGDAGAGSSETAFDAGCTFAPERPPATLKSSGLLHAVTS